MRVYVVLNRSVVPNCLQPHGPWQVRFLCPWDFFQARILEWVAISSSRGSSWTRDQTRVSCVSCIAGGFFTCWAIREARERHNNIPQRGPSYCHHFLPSMHWNAAADKPRRWDSDYLASGPHCSHIQDGGTLREACPVCTASSLWNQGSRLDALEGSSQVLNSTCTLFFHAFSNWFM